MKFFRKPFGLGAALSRAEADDRLRQYIVAILAAALAVMVRGALDPFLQSDHAFVLSLLAVVAVAWQGGFGPALVTLVLSLTGTVYFFLEPVGSLALLSRSDRIAAGLFFACGVASSLLGEAQRRAQRRAEANLGDAVRRQAALEAEIALRRDVEAERVRSEERLRDSEAQFRTLAEAAPLFVWTTRPDGSNDYFNRFWYEYTGLTPEQSHEDRWSDALHPDDRARSLEVWSRATAAESFYDIEFRFRRHDGVYRWFIGRGQPQRNSSGKIARWVGTCTDVHDQKTYAEALRKSEERYRGLTQAVPQMVWVTDATGDLLFYNQRWIDYTGITLAHGPTGWVSVIHPDDLPALSAVWRAALEGRTPDYRHEFRLRRAEDGAFRWMLSVAVPSHDDRGTTEWVGTVTDIDDQKRAAEYLERMVRDRTLELSRANEALRAEVSERVHAEARERAAGVELLRSNQELEQFAYVASHDLQEPLRKIQAFGDRLRIRFHEQLAEQGRDYIERMLSSAVRMRRLIDDLLMFSRVTTKPQSPVPIDIDGILGGVLLDLEVCIEKAGATVEAGPLPQLEADPMQMRQLFQNLIGNAIKFAAPATPPHIRITAERAEAPLLEGGVAPAGEWWAIFFQDNGIGFEGKYTDRIFQVFQRLHGRDEYEGTGVGLAICRKIVERHGGVITARSRPGHGATFIITLPAIQRSKAKESSHG